jgi:hypothetical protein
MNFMKIQTRRKSKQCRRETIELLWIILASAVALIMGLYLGLFYHDEH